MLTDYSSQGQMQEISSSWVLHNTWSCRRNKGSISVWK